MFYRLALFFFFLLAACAAPNPTATPTSPPPTIQNLNLDAETQARIARAERVVFVIPFSHWDTDWHDTFEKYMVDTEDDLLAAIRMAQRSPQFRYTIEQVLFAQNFWNKFPEHRADFKKFVENKQLTFAWGGITQADTSLAAPALMQANLDLGRVWITETFGADYLPRTAWQSDAFGNTAALPYFLKQNNIPYLFIGRYQGRCDPDYETCTPLPSAFYWTSPVNDARVLTAYFSYPTAWDAIHKISTVQGQVSALRGFMENAYTRTTSKYFFLPMGTDFQVPIKTLLEVVQEWNAQDQKNILVMADPETAFQYLETQTLPEITVDMNPIWQAFYATRPFAKRADKESAFYLTAAETFGVRSSAWHSATISISHDSLPASSFDFVWEQSQKPRFERTLETSANDLARALANIARGETETALVFNPSAYPRSSILEMTEGIVFIANVPAKGYAPLRAQTNALPNPPRVTTNGDLITLENGLVTVTLDASRGGVFTSLKRVGGAELLTGAGDEVVYWDDTQDVYGARFGDVRARASSTRATAKILAQDALLARVELTYTLGGFPITKIVTLRANEPQVEVQLTLRALDETTALVQSPTIFKTDTRTDDLGFMPFTHTINPRPIAKGDVTYRREIFYPIQAWSDLRSGANGLTLLTHGIQNIAGTDQLSFMLTRDVSDGGREGVTDEEFHTFQYAYRLHDGNAAFETIARAAEELNQPLMVTRRVGEAIQVHVPFRDGAIVIQE